MNSKVRYAMFCSLKLMHGITYLGSGAGLLNHWETAIFSEKRRGRGSFDFAQ